MDNMNYACWFRQQMKSEAPKIREAAREYKNEKLAANLMWCVFYAEQRVKKIEAELALNNAELQALKKSLLETK